MLNRPVEPEKINDYRVYDKYGKYKCYYRMYYRRGWYGTYLDGEKLPTIFFCQIKEELNNIFNYISYKWKYGCDNDMIRDLKKIAYQCPNGRFLLDYKGEKHYYLLEFCTDYGNSDYPVRIYIYEKEEE